MAANKRAYPLQQSDELRQALVACRSAFKVVAVFSLVINLMMIAPSIYMLQVYNRVLTTGHVETLLLLTGLVAAALVLYAVLDTLRSSVTARVGSWLTERLGPVLLATSVRARLQGSPGGAEPLRDVNQLQSFVGSQGLTVLFDAPWVPIYVAIIWALHPWLGMVAAVAAGLLLLLGIANEFLIRRPTMTASVKQIGAMQQAEAVVRNAEVVRAMGMLPALTKRWQTVNSAALEATRTSSSRGAVLLGATKFIRMFVQVGVLALGAWLVLRGELSGGAMIAASILLGRALQPVEQAVSTWRNFTATRIAYDRLKGRLRSFPPETDRTQLPAPLGCVSLAGVTYTAPGGKEPVLRDVSFVLKPGEAVAVIGPSASGKSTLCRLLVATSAPTSGNVRLDGSDLQHWDPEQLGQHVGYLPQEVELFAGTVRDNIARMGEGDDEAVVAAAVLAHAHDMIQQLPNGYETQIGDGGARLSGGQRQRIGLARAVYGDPKLIILDEPNANLDQVGESALAATVKALKQRGAALVIVGHRPSTLAEADKILLLRDGRVEVFGPRDEVLQRLRGAAAAKTRPEVVPVQGSVRSLDDPAKAGGGPQGVAAVGHGTVALLRERDDASPGATGGERREGEA